MYKKYFSVLCFSMLLTFMACKSDNTSSEPEVQRAEGEQIDLISNKKSMAVEISNSLINWSGSKPGKTHKGNLKIKEGTLSYAQSKLVSAQVTLDMGSITVTDLSGKSKLDLEAHLKGTTPGRENDFFNVMKYPEASFKTTKVVELKNDQDYNYLVYGMLKIKEVVQEVAFKVDADVKSDAIDISSEEFSIDRTKWGIQFKSKSIYDDLKDNFISDEIKLKITLKASADI